jgi:Putative porin
MPNKLLTALLAGLLAFAHAPAGAAEEEEFSDGEEARGEPAAPTPQAPAGEEVGVAVPPAPSPAAAEMLKSMREKGILSEDEFEDIYRRQAIYEHEEREREKAPPWFQDWTVGGDVRIRMERIDRGDLELSRVIPPSQQGLEKDLVRGEDNVDFLNNTAEGIRDRMRLRFRIGAERRLGENWTIGFRIATAQEIDLTTDYGNDVTGVDLSKRVVDYRSSNVTLGNYFEPKGIYLDRAYIQLNPEIAPALKIVAGKFENPFRSKHLPYDGLVWDEDIQPEGAALKYRFDFLPETWWTEANFGFLVLEEIGSVTVTQTSPGIATTTLPDLDDRDPYVLAYQLGTYVDTGEWMELGLRGSYYDYRNLSIRDAFILADLGNGGDAILQNPAFSELSEFSEFFERGRSAGRIKQGVLDAFITFTPFGEKWPITPFAQYTTLLSATTEPDGWGFGIQIGTPETLQVRAMWAQLNRNSTVALFTDSDLFDGYTNAKGWYISAARKLSDHVTLRLSYYSARVDNQFCIAVEEEGKPALFCDSATSQALSTAADYRRTSLDHRKRIQIDLTAEF